MMTNRWMDRAILAVVLLSVLALGIFAAFSDRFSPGISLSYEQELFGSDQVMTVDIQMDPDQWQELLDTALSEEYVSCDLTINGESYYRVGIRAKGNTSLSMVAASGSDRYSFKIKFDEYVDGQTCHGLDKLVLNNNYADATLMKEAVVYDMFSFLEVPASLFTYAKISVNGEYWGLYLALEAVEESFALRNYGTHYGKLYKPDGTQMGGPGRMEQLDPDSVKKWFDPEKAAADGSEATEDGSFSDGDIPLDGQFPGAEEGGVPPEQGNGNDFSPGNGPFEGTDGSSGGAAALNYVGDDLDSYSAIWDAEVFSSKKSDHKRVVQALKNISEGTDLEDSMDVDRVLRYLAVQTFVVNLDGLTGNMAHNYYLYEKDGQLSLVPWDYNLAFGGFQSGDASSVIHFPVDTPFSAGISTEERQFFMTLLNQEAYRVQYHAYLEELAQEYVNGGRFEAFYQKIRSQIDTLAAQDPTAFYSYEEYDAAAQMLYQTVIARAESVLGQLSGRIPATHEEQKQESSFLPDVSAIDLTVMGGMMGGGPGGQADFSDMQKPNRPNDGFMPPEQNPTDQEIPPNQPPGERGESEVPPNPGTDAESPPAVDLPAEEEKRPGPFTNESADSLIEEEKSFSQGPNREAAEESELSSEEDQATFDRAERRQTPLPENLPEEGSAHAVPNKELEPSDPFKNLPFLGGLLLVLLLAIWGVAKYRRR